MAKKISEEDKNKLNSVEKQKQTTDSKKRKKITKNTVVYGVPKRRKKPRSDKIRIALCLLYSACIVCLTMPFTTFNFERTLNTDDEIKSCQKDIDKAYDELEKAQKDLVLADKKEVEENKGLEKSKIIYPKSLAEDNVIGQKCETDRLLKLIDEAAGLDYTKYTRESYNNLLEKIYSATGTLAPSATISDTGFQLVFGNSLSDATFSKRTEGTFQRLMYSIGFLIIPIAGFFAASFDKKHHIKNIIAMVGSAFLIFVMFTFFPLEYIDYGAVISFVLYIIILILGVAGVYCKQQEDYWLEHYDECVEKGMTKWLPDGYLDDKKNAEQIKADKAQQAIVDSAKNAQKRRQKKK